MHSFFYAATVLASTLAFTAATGFDASSNSNLAVYWVGYLSFPWVIPSIAHLDYRAKEIIKSRFAISVMTNPSI